jgi:hypothetical protein
LVRHRKGWRAAALLVVAAALSACQPSDPLSGVVTFTAQASEEDVSAARTRCRTGAARIHSRAPFILIIAKTSERELACYQKLPVVSSVVAGA